MKPQERIDFVKNYSKFINDVVKGSGIFAGTLIAQAILESSGKYKTNNKWLVGGSKLSQDANNFFGIKASPSWKGDVYNIQTGEYTPSGQYYQIKDNFRKYNSVEDSIKDYVNFLQSNPRYKKAGVFDAKSVKEQAQKLQQAGYATAPNYADIVEEVYNNVSKYITENKAIIGGSTILTILSIFFIFKYFK